MKPVYIQKNCFGFLHVGSRINRATVIICSALRLDDVQGYSTLRLLAEEVASHGFAVLRLQYPGTGNSAPLGEANGWAAWLSAINASANWARDTLGADQVILCGFRLGGLLAAHVAAGRDDVAGLVLLAPTVRGRAFLRQVGLETQNSSGDRLDMGLFELGADATRDLVASNLRHAVPSAQCQVLVLAQARDGALGQAMQHWRNSGVAVSVREFGPLEPMLRPTFMNHEGRADLRPLLAWLEGVLPEGRLHEAPTVETEALSLDGCVEEPVLFGATCTLFGVLCHPAGVADAPVVIIGNPSAEPHCAAPTVDLSRELARNGIASLRIDFSGIGDSGPCGGTHVFEADRSPDFSAAVDALSARGYAVVGVGGVCSGAYHAYRFAIADDRVRFLIAINLPFFEWVSRPVEDLVFDLASHAASPSGLGTAQFWRYLVFRAVHGRLPIRRGLAHALRIVRQWTGRIDGAGDFRPGRSVRMLFLTTDNDASSKAVTARFGPAPPAGVKLQHLSGVDHGISRLGMRRIVADAISAFLTEPSAFTAPVRSIFHDDRSRAYLLQDPQRGGAAAKVADASAG